MVKNNSTKPDTGQSSGKRKRGRKPRIRETEIPNAGSMDYIQELQIRQVDLELQNEELKKEKEVNELYRLAFLKSPSMVMLIDPESEIILDANPAVLEFYGFSRDRMQNLKFSDLNINGRNTIGTPSVTGISGHEDHFIYKQKNREGCIRDVKAKFEPIKISSRYFLYAVLEDMTDQRRIKELHHEQEYWKFESLKNEGAGTFTLDFVNDSWSSSVVLDELLGIGSDTDWTLHGFLSLVHPEQRAGFQYYLFSEVIARKQNFDKEFSIIRPVDGKERWVKGTGTLEFSESGLLQKMRGFMRDITEQKSLQSTHAETVKMFDLLMTESPDGIIFFDSGGKILEVSALVPTQFGAGGKQEIIGHHFRNFIPRDERRKIFSLIARTMENNAPQTAESRLFKLDRSVFIGEISLARISKTKDDQRAFIAVVRDISERKNRERQSIHTDRMTHLGEMATGMAHEINQPLNNISLALDNVFHEMGLRDSLHDSYLQHKSNKIFDNIVKIKNLIEHIREFARDNHSYSLQPFDINEVIRNALSVFQVQFDEKRIDIVLDLEEDLGLFMGDSYKVEQVLVNLMLNAKDALEELEERSKRPVTKVVRIKSFRSNDMICIEVRDNGIGIRSGQIDKIMHPFYTTKDTGKGTGLGLSISYGLISEMNGRIEVESKYLEGTTFRICLPAAEGQN
jgi:PAS domain S-box-containing protein